MTRAILLALLVGTCAATTFLVLVAAADTAADWWAVRRMRAREARLTHMWDEQQTRLRAGHPVGPEDRADWPPE